MRTVAIATSLVVAVLTGCAHVAGRDRVIDYVSLIHAAEAGDELLVSALLDRGAPVNALGADVAGDLSYVAVHMNTPLQAAAEKGHDGIVRRLVERGAWLDAQCCDSNTPLGFAAANGHLDVVRILLAAGADRTRAGAGGTPLELAQAAGHEQIVKLLEPSTSRP